MSNEKNRSKVVLVDYEEKMSLANAAEFLETLAKKLKEDGTFTLSHGGQHHGVTPASSVELEIKLEKEQEKYKFEIELEWKDGDQGTDSGISIS